MTMLSKGLAWFQQQSEAAIGQEVYVGFTESDRKPLIARIPNSKPSGTPGNVNQNVTYFKFIFKSCDLENAGIQIKRNLMIWWGSDLFEIGYDGRVLYEYNDPLKKDVILSVVHKSNSNGIIPSNRSS